MKKCFAILAVLFFVMTASPSLFASDKKTTTHKHRDKSCCCCDMKSTKGDKKNDCGKTESKKDEEKKGAEAK